MKWAKDNSGEVLNWAKLASVLAVLPLVSTACGQVEVRSADDFDNPRIVVGAERTEAYFPLLKDLRIGIVTNHTGVLGDTHLVDTLIGAGFDVKKVFAPEHGFRGNASAGEHIDDRQDELTGMPIISLYGRNKKASATQLQDVDVVVFDIQDVGVRAYTYISTLHYMMQSCAENSKQLIVLDRPNPNGFYVDGPMLDTAYSSFVGMHSVPWVHGMTMGEYAMMVKGEGWLEVNKVLDLTVITCEGYIHSMYYELPAPPSPNLRNMTAVYLYPSLVFFEGTMVSVGRGTEKPFQIIGYPDCPVGQATFTPKAMPGAAYPPFEGKQCKGFDLSQIGEFYIRDTKQMNLQWLLGMYQEARNKEGFFNKFFDTLAGGPVLRQQIISGMDAEAIRATWQEGLTEYREVRAKYLLYP